jgi:hypothetical protein
MGRTRSRKSVETGKSSEYASELGVNQRRTENERLGPPALGTCHRSGDDNPDEQLRSRHMCESIQFCFINSSPSETYTISFSAWLMDWTLPPF